jgi:hypothetical protein
MENVPRQQKGAKPGKAESLQLQISCCGGKQPINRTRSGGGASLERGQSRAGLHRGEWSMNQGDSRHDCAQKLFSRQKPSGGKGYFKREVELDGCGGAPL